MQVSYHLTEKDVLEAQIRYGGLPFRMLHFFGGFLILVGLGAAALGESRSS
jgi:hypothetical protein